MVWMFFSVIDCYAINARTDPNCVLQSHVCTDTANRTIAGQVVSRSCWNWSDTYKCANGPVVDTCQPYVTAGCSQIGSQCISTMPDGSCSVFNQTYQCVNTPASTTTTTVCGNISTCVQGNCFQTATTPSNDFAYSVAQLAALTSAGASYSANGVNIFSGTVEHCNNAALGAKNCCAAPNGAGWGNSIVKGCPATAQNLVNGRAAGRNHFIGTNCALKDPIFGACLRTRDWACVFPSKLARIIQEQGRPQINLSWGTTANPNCRGFTPAELQQLNFGAMDLSEFYTDIMGRVTPMNAGSIGTKINNRLNNYFNSGTPTGGRIQ